MVVFQEHIKHMTNQKLYRDIQVCLTGVNISTTSPKTTMTLVKKKR